MMENKITMTNNNKKEGNDMNDAFITTPNNTINIVLQVNPEKLIGKTYKEMVEALAKTIIRNNVTVEGERPFPMEYDKYYNINQEGIIKRANVSEFDGLIVTLDVPFIETDNPTLDSICALEPIEDDEDDEYYDTFEMTDTEYMEEHAWTVGEYLDELDRSIKDMKFSLGGYINYKYDERILHRSETNAGNVMYYNDEIGVELTEEQLRSSIIGNIIGNRISIYIKEEN